MKKISLIVFVLFSAQLIFAQSKMLVPQQVYDDMKKQGKLKPGVDYVIINKNANVATPTVPVTQEHLNKMNYKSAGGGASGCSCMVPLDGTFNVAEFQGYSAPDYRNDDGSTAAKTIPFNFCLYGTNYTQLYINNNGNVSFGAPYFTFSSAPFPDPSYVMVAPFWGDVDTRAAASGLVYYKITPTYMIVKWENVGYYSNHTDKKNTFQLIITDGTDPILPGGNNIAFCYGDMQWTTGDASSGTGGFGGIPSTVGVNKGDGVNYIQIGRFDQAGAAYDGGYGANDGVSWLDNQSFYFNSCSGTNIAPIANGLNNCDTIHICSSGDTLILNGLFLSPEIGQNTTVTINLGGTPGASIVSNTPGNTASAQVMIIASAANAGNNIITFTATDNGTPAATTVVNVNVYVDTTGLAGFNPSITGNLNICQGASTTLSVTPTTYDSYLWSTGSTGTSISVNTSGQYWVTSTLNGCTKTNVANVNVVPLPTPAIVGPNFTCGSNPTTLTIDSTSLYTSYSWSNGSSSSSITVLNGTYTVTVTDPNGCVGTSPPITVSNANPQVNITGNQLFCPGDSIPLNAVPTLPSGASYSWNTGANTQIEYVNAAGTYIVNVSYVNGCFCADTVTVSQYGSPNANYTSNPLGVSPPNNPVQFTDLSTVSPGIITNWIWNFGDSTGVFHFGPNPTHIYGQDGTYIVTLAVQSSNGCWDTIQYAYTIVSEVMVPNVFTPNGDGVNDLLVFKNLEFHPGSSLLVYNRWGNKIYESSDYRNNWNGDNQKDGVYYFILKISDVDKAVTGFVQIIRGK
jgi:gliding motility-associated-like protein